MAELGDGNRNNPLISNETREILEYIKAFKDNLNFQLTCNTIQDLNIQLICDITVDKEILYWMDEMLDETVLTSKIKTSFKKALKYIKPILYLEFVAILPLTLVPYNIQIRIIANNAAENENEEKKEENEEKKDVHPIDRSKYWDNNIKEQQKEFKRIKISNIPIIFPQQDLTVTKDAIQMLNKVMRDVRYEIRKKVHFMQQSVHKQLQDAIKQDIDDYAITPAFDLYNFVGIYKQKLLKITIETVNKQLNQGSNWTTECIAIAKPKIVRLIVMNGIDFIEYKRAEVLNKLNIMDINII